MTEGRMEGRKGRTRGKVMKTTERRTDGRTDGRKKTNTRMMEEGNTDLAFHHDGQHFHHRRHLNPSMSPGIGSQDSVVRISGFSEFRIQDSGFSSQYFRIQYSVFSSQYSVVSIQYSVVSSQ